MKLPKLYADSSGFTEDILDRTARSSRRGDGVLIAVTSSLTSERTHSYIRNEIEFLLHVHIFNLALI